MNTNAMKDYIELVATYARTRKRITNEDVSMMCLVGIKRSRKILCNTVKAYPVDFILTRNGMVTIPENERKAE